jgi:hypothetical protein
MISIMRVAGYGCKRDIITISFGKKPDRGGKPLIDKIIRGIIIYIMLNE